MSHATGSLVVIATAAESMPLTPQPVAETLVRVIVGFGGGWADIWRLQGGGGCDLLGKVARKER